MTICGIKRLVGRPVDNDAPGIDLSVFQHLLRLDGERITQAGDQELVALRARFGDHDTRLRP